MKRVLIIAAIVLAFATGCATVEVSTPEMSIKTRTLWKDIETASAQTEDLVLELGKSTSSDDAKTMMAICLLFPTAEGCPKG